MNAAQDDSKCGIPVIDMTKAETELAREMRSACTHYGFFSVVGHGVCKELVTDTFAKNKAFFALPVEEKMKIKADKNFRGYTPMQDETLDPTAKSGDTKEGLYFGREMPPDDPQPLSGPNQWPSEVLIPGYRKTTDDYVQAVSDLGFQLTQLLALSLDLPKTHFDEYFQQPMIFLRPLHYSADISCEKEGKYGAGAHTDYGMLTILKTSDEKGLQVHVDGRWIEVDPPEDGFIINLGDMLERWTNKVFKSTIHRVMSTGKERYSIPFFYEPAFYSKVECLPSCCSPEKPPQFPPTTSGQHILDMYSKTHASYSEELHSKN